MLDNELLVFHQDQEEAICTKAGKQAQESRRQTHQEQ